MLVIDTPSWYALRERESNLVLMRAIRYGMLLAVLCVGLPGLAFAHDGHAHTSVGAAQNVSSPSVEISVQQASVGDTASNSSHHVFASARSSTIPCAGGCCCTGMSSCSMGSCCYSSLTPSANMVQFIASGDPVPHQLDRNTALLMILGLDRPPKA